MLRQASTTRVMDLPQISKHRPLLSPRRKMEGVIDLPLQNRNSSDNKKEISQSQLPEKLVHLIPVVVLLCLFTLWWFSYPVSLESEDGRRAAAYQLMTQNTTFSNPIFPPSPSISEM